MPSKTQELKATYGAKIKSNGGVNAFDLKYDLDRFDKSDNFGVLRTQGRNDATAWLKTATEFEPKTVENDVFEDVPNPKYPAHAKAIKLFADKFGNNVDRVYEHYIGDLLTRHREKRNGEMKAAEEDGKKQSVEFFKILYDVNHSGNETAVKRYKTEFHSNLFEVEPAFIEAQYKKHGYTRPPVRDINYEKSLTKGFAPADAFEETILASLVDLFDLKWKATASYKGDREVYEIFLKENLPISGSPIFKPKK